MLELGLVVILVQHAYLHAGDAGVLSVCRVVHRIQDGGRVLQDRVVASVYCEGVV